MSQHVKTAAIAATETPERRTVPATDALAPNVIRRLPNGAELYRPGTEPSIKMPPEVGYHSPTGFVIVDPERFFTWNTPE